MSDAAPEASGAAPGPSADPPAARSPPVEEADPSGAAKPAAVPVEAADINGSYGASSSAASAQLAVASPLLAGAADGAETPPAEQPQPLGLPEGASLLNKKSAYMDASTRERSGRKLKFADQVSARAGCARLVCVCFSRGGTTRDPWGVFKVRWALAAWVRAKKMARGVQRRLFFSRPT